MSAAIQVRRPSGLMQRRLLSSATAIRVGIGTLLLAAALSKTATSLDPKTTTFATEFPWAVHVLSAAELLLGVLLICGVLGREVWISAVGLFLVFWVFALYRAIAGYETCGCFGQVEINPWWMVFLDSAVLAILLRYRSAYLKWPDGNERKASSILGAGAFGVGQAVTAVLLLAFAMPTAYRAAATVFGERPLVFLQPADWVDQQFPLSDHLSPKFDFSDGEWIVLLYHHDCSACVDILPDYELLARRITENRRAPNVLIVEVPPLGEAIAPLGHAFRAQLSRDRQWIVQTPVEIRIDNGIVTSATQARAHFATSL
jgi:hypothetical protein